MDNARFKTFTIHYIINNEWHKRIYDDTFLIHSILLYLRVVTPISGIPDSSLVLDRLPVICRKMVEVKSGVFFALSNLGIFHQIFSKQEKPCSTCLLSLKLYCAGTRSPPLRSPITNNSRGAPASITVAI